MVVRLRLQRFGRTHAPFYRMVAANARAPRDGKFLEIVGTYNPIANKAGMKEIRLKEDRLKYWLAVGAQPSGRVAWILGQIWNFTTPAPSLQPTKNETQKRTERGELKRVAKFLESTLSVDYWMESSICRMTCWM